jgi:hypothetical protein
MADVESAAAAFVENETAQQESSQDTQVVEEQAVAPTTPFEGLQSRLRDHPHDTVAWQDLINIAEDSGDLKLISTAYDSLLKVYPNTVSQHLLIEIIQEEWKFIPKSVVLDLYFYFIFYMCDSNVSLTCARSTHRSKPKLHI